MINQVHKQQLRKGKMRSLLFFLLCSAAVGFGFAKVAILYTNNFYVIFTVGFGAAVLMYTVSFLFYRRVEKNNVR